MKKNKAQRQAANEVASVTDPVIAFAIGVSFKGRDLLVTTEMPDLSASYEDKMRALLPAMNQLWNGLVGIQSMDSAFSNFLRGGSTLGKYMQAVMHIGNQRLASRVRLEISTQVLDYKATFLRAMADFAISMMADPEQGNLVLIKPERPAVDKPKYTVEQLAAASAKRLEKQAEKALALAEARAKDEAEARELLASLN